MSKTLIERAAEYVWAATENLDGVDLSLYDDRELVARAVFESIDRDALIELLRLTDYGPDGWHGAEVLADAILAHLTGGAE